MLARISIAILLALPLLAAAGPHGKSTSCCNSVQNADDKSVAGILGFLGVAVQGLTGQVGLTCNPISGIGIGGNSCASQPVCCTDNSFNGVIALGCSPINVNL
ncbi:hydrophobin-251 [Lyophyllum atratum]|nr:hydrophobin-251 [Lyophyllum atratum]